MTRIQSKLTQLRREGRGALIPFITMGDPSLEMTGELILQLERSGADIIELGIPFSDPLADGPVIQRASERALARGVTVRKALQLVAHVRRQTEVPLLLFSYFNPLFACGFEALSREARICGVDGFLITDLSVEEAQGPVQTMRQQGLDTVFLAAPTSTDKRIESIARFSSGFIYAVSRTGVTGEQKSLSADVAPLLQRIRKQSDLPVAVGFGISEPSQVQEVWRLADAAVVGSAMVRCIEEHGVQPDLCARVGNFTRWLKGGR
ncbi:MAG: tryptophan synthase subunit alpha [Acidobacteriota bacterium]